MLCGHLGNNCKWWSGNELGRPHSTSQCAPEPWGIRRVPLRLRLAQGALLHSRCRHHGGGHLGIVVTTEEGRHAYREGKPMMDNPYAEGSPEHIWWCEGWRMEWWGEKEW